MSHIVSSGRIAGLLLLVLLSAGLMTPYILLGPVHQSPGGFLEHAAPMATLLRVCVVMMLVANSLPLVITALTWPYVRERVRILATFSAGLAVTNLAMQLNENAHWMNLLTLSLSRADAGALSGDPYAIVALSVRAAWKWAHYSHIFVVVAWLFSYFLVLARTRLAPTPLAGMAMLCCVLQFVGITVPVFAGFRNPYAMAFGLPLAFGIVALSGLLLWRGYRQPAA